MIILMGLNLNHWWLSSFHYSLSPTTTVQFHLWLHQPNLKIIGAIHFAKLIATLTLMEKPCTTSTTWAWLGNVDNKSNIQKNITYPTYIKTFCLTELFNTIYIFYRLLLVNDNVGHYVLMGYVNCSTFKTYLRHPSYFLGWACWLNLFVPI